MVRLARLIGHGVSHAIDSSLHAATIDGRVTEVPMKLPWLVLTALTLGAGLCELCRPAEAHAAVGRSATLASPASATVDTVVLNIEGMDCGGCTIATRKVLERLDGVTKAEVSYEAKRAVVTFDPQKVTTEQMIAAVATLKYTATVEPAGAQPAVKPAAKPVVKRTGRA